MRDAVREYLELALGVTEASRKRATKVIEGLVGKGGEFVDKGGATAKQVQALAGELMATSVANREALAKLVRFEVDRALGAVGLATAEEVDELTRRVRDLERQLAAAASATLASGPESESATRAGQPKSESNGSRVAKASTRKNANALVTGPGAAQPAAAKKSATRKSAARKSAANEAAANEAVAKKTAPEKTVAKKTVAKKAVAKKAPAGTERP